MTPLLTPVVSLRRASHVGRYSQRYTAAFEHCSVHCRELDASHCPFRWTTINVDFDAEIMMFRSYLLWPTASGCWSLGQSYRILRWWFLGWLVEGVAMKLQSWANGRSATNWGDCLCVNRSNTMRWKVGIYFEWSSENTRLAKICSSRGKWLIMFHQMHQPVSDYVGSGSLAFPDIIIIHHSEWFGRIQRWWTQ